MALYELSTETVIEARMALQQRTIRIKRELASYPESSYWPERLAETEKAFHALDVDKIVARNSIFDTILARPCWCLSLTRRPLRWRRRLRVQRRLDLPVTAQRRQPQGLAWPELRDARRLQSLRALLLEHKPADQDAASWLAYWGFDERRTPR
jgi:hypothetical protein